MSREVARMLLFLVVIHAECRFLKNLHFAVVSVTEQLITRMLMPGNDIYGICLSFLEMFLKQ